MPPLIRTLRLTDLLFLFIGSVIGSGIFLTPSLILQQLGGSVGLSLLVWFVGGILSLLGALTYAELAAVQSRSRRPVLLHSRWFRPDPRISLWLESFPDNRQWHHRSAGTRFQPLPRRNHSALANRQYRRRRSHDRGGHRGKYLGHSQKFRPAKLDHANKGRHGSHPQRCAALHGPPCGRSAASPWHFTTRIFTGYPILVSR